MILLIYLLITNLVAPSLESNMQETFPNHPWGTAKRSDQNEISVISDLLKSMGGFFQGFSLKQSADITDISLGFLPNTN